jgi:hypothetical protein
MRWNHTYFYVDLTEEWRSAIYAVPELPMYIIALVVAVVQGVTRSIISII